MRLIVSIALYIQYFTVEGSTCFGQCHEKQRAVSVFNWASQARSKRGLSPIHLPAVAFVPKRGTKWWKFTTNDYYDKMILDTGSSESSFNSLFKDSGPVDVVRVGLGGKELVDVSAVLNQRLPHRAGILGVGPYSPVMKKIEKLEITIRNGQYRKVRSGPDVDDSGYRFADTITIDRYPQAWAVEGFIVLNSTEIEGILPMRIVLDTLGYQGVPSYPEVFKVVIADSAFSLLGDQFFIGADHAMVVSPMNLGSPNDIRILLDASGETKRVGFKVLGPNKLNPLSV